MTRIPLFPLRTALFPGVTLPLRIFEQRYLRLVSESMRAGEGFGIALIRSGREVGGAADVWPYGLLVEIVDWSQGEGGLLNIAVSGHRRFRILQTEPEEDGLLYAEVEWLPPEQIEPVPEDCDGLVALLEELKTHAAMMHLGFEPVESANALSWQLAQLLPLDDAEREDLLAMATPLERIARIAESVKRWAVG